MRPIHVTAVLFAFAVASVGCADAEEEASNAGREWEVQADEKKPGETTTPGADGETPATTTPGTAPGGSTECVAKTCADLAKTSGTADDGCGKTLDCSKPAAATCSDVKESNNTKEAAADLGAMTDNPTSSRLVADLSLSDSDVDWFKFKVTDGGFGGNPQIDVSVTVATAEVSVFFVCDSQPDYSTCTNAGDTADTTVGKGCRAKGKVSLTTNCSGITETGMAYVRVKKSAADSQCTQYALTVKVD